MVCRLAQPCWSFSAPSPFPLPCGDYSLSVRFGIFVTSSQKFKRRKKKQQRSKIRAACVPQIRRCSRRRRFPPVRNSAAGYATVYQRLKSAIEPCARLMTEQDCRSEAVFSVRSLNSLCLWSAVDLICGSSGVQMDDGDVGSTETTATKTNGRAAVSQGSSPGPQGGRVFRITARRTISHAVPRNSNH